MNRDFGYLTVRTLRRKAEKLSVLQIYPPKMIPTTNYQQWIPITKYQHSQRKPSLTTKKVHQTKLQVLTNLTFPWIQTR